MVVPLYGCNDEGTAGLQLENSQNEQTNYADTYNHYADKTIYRISHSYAAFWWVTHGCYTQVEVVI